MLWLGKMLPGPNFHHRPRDPCASLRAPRGNSNAHFAPSAQGVRAPGLEWRENVGELLVHRYVSVSVHTKYGHDFTYLGVALDNSPSLSVAPGLLPRMQGGCCDQS